MTTLTVEIAHPATDTTSTQPLVLSNTYWMGGPVGASSREVFQVNDATASSDQSEKTVYEVAVERLAAGDTIVYSARAVLGIHD